MFQPASKFPRVLCIPPPNSLARSVSRVSLYTISMASPKFPPSYALPLFDFLTLLSVSLHRPSHTFIVLRSSQLFHQILTVAAKGIPPPSLMRIVPDKSFMRLSAKERYNLYDHRFRDGLDAFLNYAGMNPKRRSDGKIFCPYKKCRNRYMFGKEEVREHVLNNGFEPNYTYWNFHGEGTKDSEPRVQNEATTMQTESSLQDMIDDTNQMLDDLFVGNFLQENVEDVNDDGASLNVESLEELHKLAKDNDRDLYDGCTKFSRLSFLILLFHLKAMSRMPNKYFEVLLDLLRKVIPNGEDTIPKNYYEARKIVKILGLDCEKIDACPNDCVLYRNDYANNDECPTCKVSRWKKEERTSTKESIDVNPKRRKIPAKILRYFPITRRLQRFFLFKDIAKDMRWHIDSRVNDGKLRHPADAEVWKHLDRIYPDFGEEPRNIHLGLATDGFNPYGAMSSGWSTWPVLLMPYNLPPWMCMKQPRMILALLIPGKFSPGNDIDVYLAPLIEELENLWSEGARTYDAYTGQNFTMRATILWTINDFPAYGNISGWSTYAYHACPVCGLDYKAQKLGTKGKFCYWFHRRWLPPEHSYRVRSQEFDGTVELQAKPKQLSGQRLKNNFSNFNASLEKIVITQMGRKTRKESESKMKTCYLTFGGRGVFFFNLTYWEHLKIRHNLDVMHIEKNVCDNILSTLLQDSKSKDNINARKDLEKLKIRTNLHLIPRENGNAYLMLASVHTMSKDQMRRFCEVLKSVKSPDGYSSNISKNVNVEKSQISNLKTHDMHVILHQLLPVALQHNISPVAYRSLIEFSAYFDKLCSKVIDVSEFELMEKSIVETLCKLEMIFPPSLFIVMVHLTVHLVTEAKIAGPVHYRWMYPVERYLGFLKRQLRNRARPEGSITENYIANECLTFASRYLRGVETRLNCPPRNVEGELSCPQGDNRAYRREWLDQAHFYILNNLQIIAEYKSEHLELLAKRITGRRVRMDVDKTHRKEFPSWFQFHVAKKIAQRVHVLDDVVHVSKGPCSKVSRYGIYCINNLKFHTTYFEEKRDTQNNGIFCPFEQICYSSSSDQHPISGQLSFYGQLEDIIELSYGSKQEIWFVMFKVRWCSSDKSRDEYGFQVVNLNKEIHKDDKFMLASQADQCFYVKDPNRQDVWIALRRPPRSLFDSPLGEAYADDNEPNDFPAVDGYELNFYYVQASTMQNVLNDMPSVPPEIVEDV